MFFNLTESPWIRAGRQYSVRVRYFQPCKAWHHIDRTPDRTSGHTRITARQSETSQQQVSLRMVLLLSFFRTLGMSLQAYIPCALCGTSARIRMVHTWMEDEWDPLSNV